VSLASGRSVSAMLGERLGNTLLLAGLAAIVAMPLAIVLGLVAIIHRDGLVDRAISSVTLVCAALPEFFIGYVLIIVFGRVLGWFPSLAEVPENGGWLATLHGLALPLSTLVLVSLAHTMRLTRASIAEVLDAPYIEMATLKGLPHWLVIVRHALPNAVAAIASVIAFGLAYLVVGVVIVEVVFVYPGMGQLMVDAVSSRDIPLIQACGLVVGATYVVLNLVADVIAIVSNPRLLHPC